MDQPVDKEQGDHKQKSSPRLRFWGIVGLVVIAALITGGVLLWIYGLPFRGFDTSYTVYYEGNVDIPKDSPVLYRRTTVGKVESVVTRGTFLQLLASRPGMVERRDVATLPVGASATLEDNTIVKFAGDALLIVHDDITLHVRFDSLSMEWYIPARDLSERVFLNDIPQKSLGPGDTAWSDPNGRVRLLPGDAVRFEWLSIVWSNPGPYTVVSVRLDTNQIAKLANSSMSMGPGASLSVNSTFGLTAPVLRLESSIESEALFRDKPVELIPYIDIDIQQVIDQAGRYISDKEYMRRPPRNRVQKLVADLNSTVEDISTMTDRVKSFGLEHGRWRTKSQNNVEDIIANVDSILLRANAAVDQLTNTANLQVDKLGNTTNGSIVTVTKSLEHNLDSLTKSVQHSIDSLQKEIDIVRVELTRQAGTTISNLNISMAQTLGDLSATLRKVEELLISIQGKVP